MQIKKLKIFGFGALCDFAIDFTENITCVFEQNGFGKTTLASFIKAMFYSMPTARKTDSAKSSERIRFLPWSGNRYGGMLEFEVNGKSYRVSRIFDRMSETKDAFEIVDAVTSLKCDDYSEKLGEELFGVDAEGFERTTFFSLNSEIDTVPKSIENVIINSSGNFDAEDDGKKALKRLSDEIKNIEGKNKLLDTLNFRLQSAQRELERCEQEKNEYFRLSEELKNDKKELEALSEKRNGYDTEISNAHAVETEKLKIKNAEKAALEYAECREKIKKINEKYKEGMLTSENIGILRDLDEKIKKDEFLISSEKARISGLAGSYEKFQKNMPSDEEISDANAKAYELKNADARLEKLWEQKNTCAQKLKEFPLEISALPDLKTVSEMKSKLSSAPLKQKTKRSFVIPKILSALLFLSGIALCFFNLIVGVAVAAVGAVALISFFLISTVQKMTNPLLNNGREIFEFCRKYSVSQSEAPALLDSMEEMLKLSDETKKCETEISELEQNKILLNASLSEFFENYEITEKTDAVLALSELVRQRDNYITVVLPAFETVSKTEKSLSESTAVANRLVSGMLVNFESAYFSDVIKNAELDIAELERLSAELEDKKAYAEKLKSEINPDIDLSGQKNTDELFFERNEVDEKIKNLSDEATQKRLKAERLSQSFEKMSELEETVGSLREEITANEKRLSDLKNAYTFLDGAILSLSQKYTGKLNSLFKKYAEFFPEKLTHGLTVAPELKLYFERESIGRETSYFSDGTKCVFDICLRLALIDAVYENQKPIFILDDPFSTLDEQNIDSALSLLKSVSENIQVLYLTCHQSRLMK